MPGPDRLESHRPRPLTAPPGQRRPHRGARRRLLAVGVAAACALSGCALLEQLRRLTDSSPSQSAPAARFDYRLEERGIGVTGALGEVTFEARAGEQPADGELRPATARYVYQGETLTIRVAADGRVSAHWGDRSADGDGALTPEEAAFLDDLFDAFPLDALRAVALRLGCEADGLFPGPMAALVFPWQLHLKYRAPLPARAALDAASEVGQCRYFTLQQSGRRYGDGVRPKGPLALDETLPFPRVIGYPAVDDEGWTVDGEGADAPPPIDAVEMATAMSTTGRLALDLFHLTSEVEACIERISYPQNFGPASPYNDPGRPGRCRGACGKDCPPHNCRLSIERRCLDGQHAGIFEVQTCKTHEGCRRHDKCYDCCVESWGYDVRFSLATTAARPHLVESVRCHLACDRDAQVRHGASNLPDWASGGSLREQGWPASPLDDEEMVFEYYLRTVRAPECEPGLCEPPNQPAGVDASWSLESSGLADYCPGEQYEVRPARRCVKDCSPSKQANPELMCACELGCTYLTDPGTGRAICACDTMTTRHPINCCPRSHKGYNCD